MYGSKGIFIQDDSTHFDWVLIRGGSYEKFEYEEM